MQSRRFRENSIVRHLFNTQAKERGGGEAEQRNERNWMQTQEEERNKQRERRERKEERDRICIKPWAMDAASRLEADNNNRDKNNKITRQD